MSIPRSVKELRSISGLFNNMRHFVQGYAEIVSPLHDLTRKNRNFELKKEYIEAIKEIRRILADDAMLFHFDPKRETRMLVDASDFAFGSILQQKDGDDYRSCHYYSARLVKYIKSYTISEKECFAVVAAVRKFQQYREGHEFTVVTDHHALCQLSKIAFRNQRIKRWQIEPSSYNSCMYRKSRVQARI